MTDPRRLLESAELSLAARALLEEGRNHAVDYDVAAGEARFRDSLALLSGATLAGSAIKSSSGKLLLAKLGAKIGIALLAGSGVLGIALWQATPVGTPAPVLVRPERVAPAPVVMEQVVSAPARIEVAPVVGPAKRRRRARVEAAVLASTPMVEAAPVVTPSVVAQPPVSLRELQGIARARTLVQRDPEAAVALLDAQRSEFPNAMFAEERDALTVLALARAGKRALAREQAAVFLRRHPNGPFSDGVRAAAH